MTIQEIAAAGQRPGGRGERVVHEKKNGRRVAPIVADSTGGGSPIVGQAVPAITRQAGTPTLQRSRRTRRRADEDAIPENNATSRLPRALFRLGFHLLCASAIPAATRGNQPNQ